VRPHPCAGIERDNRLAVTRLLRELDLDTDVGTAWPASDLLEPGSSTCSRRGRPEQRRLIITTRTRNCLGAANMRMRRFGRHVRRAEPNQRAAFVAVIHLIKSGRFSVRYIADRTGHNEITIRHWLNGSTQQPRIDTLLNVARLYGLESMRTLCAMTPNQIARAERQKHRRVNRTTSRPR
jgi:hypothetical protein